MRKKTSNFLSVVAGFIAFIRANLYISKQDRTINHLHQKTEGQLRFPSKTSFDGTFGTVCVLLRYNQLISEFEIYVIFYTKKDDQKNDIEENDVEGEGIEKDNNTPLKKKESNKHESVENCGQRCLRVEAGYLVQEFILVERPTIKNSINKDSQFQKYLLMVSNDPTKVSKNNSIPEYKGMWLRISCAETISFFNNSHREYLQIVVKNLEYYKKFREGYMNLFIK